MCCLSGFLGRCSDTAPFFLPFFMWRYSIIYMKKTFNVIATLKDAWRLFLAHKKFYLEVVLVFGLIALVADWLREEDSMRVVDIILSIINTVATWYGSIVLMKASLSVAVNKPIGPGVYSLDIYTVITLILASLLVGIGTLIGFILLIVPGVIFALRTSMAQYIVLDERSTALSGVKKSITLTKGYTWSLFQLTLCFIALAALSMFPLFGLGFIVLIPVSTIAMSLVYQKIKAEQAVVIG